MEGTLNCRIKSLKGACTLGVAALILLSSVFPVCMAESSGAGGGVFRDSYITVKGDFIVLGNSYIEIVITLGNNTGGGVYSVKDKLRGVDFIRNKACVSIGLFALEYWYDPINWYAALLGRNAEMRYSYIVNDTGVVLHLYWSGLTSTHEKGRFSVNVHVEIYVPDNSSFTYWRLEFENRDKVTIENVIFPIIVGLDQISSEEEGDYLVIPSWSGMLFKNPVRNLKEGRGFSKPNYPSGFLNMQFVAYYSSNPPSGLYLADYDETGTYVKSFGLNRPPGGVCVWLANTHVPSFENQAKVALHYSVVLGVFSGDWYDAAQIYKAWASKQWWAKGNLTTGKDTPLWLKKSGVVIDFFTRYWERYSSVWNGPYSNMPPTAEAFRAYYNVTPIMWWRGWEKNGFGMTMPEYFPPTEGWESFDAAIQGVHRRGGKVMVPVPAISSYSFNASGWQEAVNYAPRDRWGNLYTYTWYIHNNSGVLVKQVSFTMTPTDFWLNKILNITIELLCHGMDVVQLDGGPPPPYINYHGTLPKGGSNWWADEYLKIYHIVRVESRKINPTAAIGSEWFAESYIPYIDLAQDQAIGGLDPTEILSGIFYNNSLNSYIPLWQVVYHENMLLFSSILFIDGRDSLYYLRNLALSLVWGDIPMITADPQGTGRPYNLKLYDRRMLEYSRRVVEARSKYAYHYLVEGVMLRPPRVSPNPRILIPGAKSIPYTGVDVKPFYSDSVFASAWLAPDRSVGIVVTSIWGERLNVTVLLEGYSVLEEGRNYTVYYVINGEVRSVYSTSGIPREVTLTLAPNDVALVAIAPYDSLRSKALLKLWEAIGRSELLLVKGNPQADRMLQLITYSFKNNEFQESILLAEKLLENLTVLHYLIGKIHAVNNTIVGSYGKATMRVLRELLDNASVGLREAGVQARNFNFDAAEELIKSSEQNLNQFYTLLDRIVEVENELDQLAQLLVAVNKTVVNMEARQRLERANNLIREAGESINLGKIEEAKSLLAEVKLLIEEAKSLEEKSQLSLAKLNLAIAIIIGIAIITILLMVLKTRRRAEKRNI
jgi:hypothetical protein